MKLVSFVHEGNISAGIVNGERVVDTGHDIEALLESPALRLNCVADHTRDEVTLLPPVPAPKKIFCIGINYDAHRLETGRDKTKSPVVFTRYARTLVPDGGCLVRPRVSNRFDFEGELAVVIGRTARHVAARDALDFIAGWSCFNDGSVRDWQRHTSQFTPGKNFDCTGGFGPWIVTRDEIPNPTGLDLETRVNDVVMQSSNTERLIFDVPHLIEYISTFTTLDVGDVIATGTPSGVGDKRDPPIYLRPGDRVTVTIAKVGTLSNLVVQEDEGIEPVTA